MKSQVDQGKRYPTRYVGDRSLRPTPGCFLSPGHWKDGIMLAKGKAPKVPPAAGSSGSRSNTFPSAYFTAWQPPISHDGSHPAEGQAGGNGTTRYRRFLCTEGDRGWHNRGCPCARFAKS